MTVLTEPGDLSRTPLAAVLLEALNAGATGVLEVVHGGGTSRLWFRDGRPVGAQVFTGFRPLGLMLLQEGLIDVDALSRSLAAMAETHRPQGEILVEMGAVTPEDVERALAEQQAEYFRTIAALDSGAFVFEASASVPQWTRGSRLSPVRTIVDALERPQARALVASALQPLFSKGIRLAAGYAQAGEAFRWTDAERRLVARLEAPIGLEALLARPELPPERARAIAAALLLLGFARAAEEASSRTGDTGVGLAVEPEADASADRAAAPAAPARRSDPAEARARRQRLLQQAIQNMGIGPFAARAGTAAGDPGSPAAAGTPAPAAAPAAPSGPEAELRQALLRVAPRARERDLFARLGLPETAGREDAKRAFLQLARQFHPDRFASPALADLHDVVKDFFASVNEAYEVLSNDRKRAEYLSRRGSASTARAESAHVDFQKGEACLRTRDWARARGFLESAVRADPTPEHQAALAQACLLDPARRDRERARALLAEATKDRSCDRALYASGLLARDEGNEGEAERWMRAALKVNPRNPEALRELRALEARRASRRR